MYGGYGNIWNQGATQWPTGNVPSQNQNVQNPQLAGTMNAAQTFQSQQQAMTGYGGTLQNSGMVGTNAAQTGMMGYMNMGMNPYMNYGGNAALMNTNPNAAWLGNQYGYQQQQQYLQSMTQAQQTSLSNFPGGRPPLPPGPPPPDKPSTNDTSNQKQGLLGSTINQTTNISTSSNLNPQQQPPLPPYANPSLSHQRPPPPPPPTNFNVTQQQQRPPPPPPSGPHPTQSAPKSLLGTVPGLIANTTTSTSGTLQTEDAYNIIKSAAALGILPSNGSLTPQASLNVSEELFGSKSSKGIPGLDMVDDSEQDHRSPKTEVIDLEKEPKPSGKAELKINLSNEGSDKTSNEPTRNDVSKERSQWKNVPSSIKNTTEVVKSRSEERATPKKNELVWELRPEIQEKSWARDLSPKSDKPQNTSSIWGGESSKSAFEKKFSDNDSGVFTNNSNNEETSKENSSNSSSSESKTGGKIVRIPLVPAEGQPLIYDRKTLKQFDQIFRDWEAQFENWKRANENHADRNAYQEYLDQWNKWRCQLLEQRRSIMEAMTKAKLESKEILIAKMEGIDDQQPGDSPAATARQGSKDSFPSNVETQPTKFGGKNTDSDSVNPFEAALQASDVGKRTAPAAPSLSNNIESNSMVGQSLLRNPDRSDNREWDRPVEKVLRNGGGGGRSDQNSFENRPNQFKMGNSYEDNLSGPRDGSNQQNKLEISPFEMGRRSYGDKPSEVRSGSKDSKLDNNNPFDLGNSYEDNLPGPRDRQNKSDINPFEMGRRSFGDKASEVRKGSNQDSKVDMNPFQLGRSSFGNNNASTTRDDNSQYKNDSFDSKTERSSLPFDWSLPSQQHKPEKNPFEMASNNPFMQPCGQNPFEFEQEAKLPSLDDFIKQTKVEFPSPSSSQNRQQQMMSSNLFSMNMSGSSMNDRQNAGMRMENPVERIRRDPLGDSPSQNSKIGVGAALRLEANPVGMPLLIAAKEDPPPKDDLDDLSHLFSRDRGPTVDVAEHSKEFQLEDLEEADVIDYAAANSLDDDLDFPRGENPNAEEEEDFSLEDPVVVDYSQVIPPNDSGNFHEYGEPEYHDEFNHGYPPFHEPPGRGRGRGFPPGHWGGHGFPPRGYPPGHHMYGRGPPIHDPHYEEFGPVHPRGRPYARGMPMGRGVPEPQWYAHDDRDLMPQHLHSVTPPVVELSPSPEPVPAIKIAPPNPEFDRERRRSRSRERIPRGREERSRSRERISRRGGREESAEKRDRKRENSPYSSRRDRERDKRNSPDRRGTRNEDRRDRDRHHRDRRARSKSRSKSPAAEDRQSLVRNPLFPSASAGMLSSTASNPLPPRYQTVLIEDILNIPGRSKRPPRLVIFMRGLPGSGKSHCVGLIKEREIQMGGKAPRILSIDNYFTTEIEEKEKDPATGLEVKKTVLEYDYDEEREPLYRAQLVRQFRKTLDEGFFSFVIVDCVNEFVRHFDEMSNFATQKRFQVYVAEIEESVDVCVKRNLHKRTKDEIVKLNKVWERTPSTYIKLDTRTLLQDEAVQDVEMEDVSDVETDNNTEKALTPAERGKIGPQVEELEDIEDEDSGDILLVSAGASKWDTIEPSQEKLNKLDGLVKKRRTNDEDTPGESGRSIEAWLTSNTTEDYDVQRREIKPGQKRVRWADIEERREQERMREMGFVVGHTDWKRMMDPTFGSSALTKTKFI